MPLRDAYILFSLREKKVQKKGGKVINYFLVSKMCYFEIQSHVVFIIIFYV